MQLELLQSAVGGDLVLGECKMRIADVVAAGTVHSWFPFVDAGNPPDPVAQLLMAIQCKKGKQGKQTTPKNEVKKQVPALVAVRHSGS